MGPTLRRLSHRSHYFTEMCSGSEAGSYLRLIDSCITQLKAQGPSRTWNERKEEAEEAQVPNLLSVSCVRVRVLGRAPRYCLPQGACTRSSYPYQPEPRNGYVWLVGPSSLVAQVLILPSASKALPPLGGLRRFRSPQISGGHVTTFAPHKVLKLIAWRQVDF